MLKISRRRILSVCGGLPGAALSIPELRIKLNLLFNSLLLNAVFIHEPLGVGKVLLPRCKGGLMEYGKVGFGDAPSESLLLLPGGFSLLAVLTQSRNGVAGIFCRFGVRLPKHINGKLQFPDFADGHIGGIGNRIRRMLLFGNVGVGLFNGFKTPGKGEKQFSSPFDIWVIVSELRSGIV